MKPVCVPCRRFFRPKRNGFAFIEGIPTGGSLRVRLPGNAEPDRWRPYKAWHGDLWACPTCGAEIIVGVAGEPFAEHYQLDFAERVALSGATVQINDC